jgi:hypothetical protein
MSWGNCTVLTVEKLRDESYWTILSSADTVTLEAFDLVGPGIIQRNFPRYPIESTLSTEQAIHPKCPVNIGQVIFFKAGPLATARTILVIV